MFAVAVNGAFVTVNELTGGWGRRTEGFGVGTEDDWTRLRKSDVGYTLGQFNPHLNALGLIPRANFGSLPTTGGDGVDLNYPDRIGDTAVDYVASIRDTMTWARDKHTFKFGGYLEYMENHESRGGKR